MPTRGHMIDCLVNLALNLGPKIHQKSTQEHPKIDPKSIKKHGQDMIRFLIVFWSILDPNLAPRSLPDPQLGAQEGPGADRETQGKRVRARSGQRGLGAPGGSQYPPGSSWLLLAPWGAPWGSQELLVSLASLAPAGSNLHPQRTLR